MRTLQFICLITIYLFGCAAQSPLIQAVSSGDLESAKKLITKGANVNERDSNGATPLMHAVMSGNSERVKTLLGLGANVNIQDSDGYSALFYAVSYGYKEICSILLENDADVNARTRDGDTPLMLASSYCNSSIVELLIEDDADVNAKNNSNGTAIHYGVLCSSPANYDITQLLIEGNADLTIKDSYGKIPLIYALDYRYLDVAALIRTKYHDNWNVESASFDEALRSPSRIQPDKDTYAIPSGKENDYANAIIDCNYMIIPYKKGLLLATGPVGYGLGLAWDQLTLGGKFQKCMEKMGFQCVKDCSK